VALPERSLFYRFPPLAVVSNQLVAGLTPLAWPTDLTPKFQSIVNFGPAVSNNRSSRHEKDAFHQEQIIGVLKEAETGIKVPELCRKHGISDVTFYKWRSKYVGYNEVTQAVEILYGT